MDDTRVGPDLSSLQEGNLLQLGRLIRQNYRKGLKPQLYSTPKFHKLYEYHTEESFRSARIHLEKEQYSEGETLQGFIRLVLSKPTKNEEVKLTLKCLLVHDVKERVNSFKHPDQLARALAKQIEGNYDIVKLIEGSQVVVYAEGKEDEEELVVPELILPGENDISFEFQIPECVPTSQLLLISGLRIRIHYFIQAKIGSLLIYQEFLVQKPARDVLDSQVVSVIDFRATELCCLDMGTHRLELSSNTAAVKQGGSPSLSLKYYRLDRGECYHVDQLTVDLWLFVKFCENEITSKSPQSFRLSPVLVATRELAMEGAKTEGGVTSMTFLMPLPKGLPSCQENEILSVYYLLSARVQMDSCLSVVDERMRGLTLTLYQ